MRLAGTLSNQRAATHCTQQQRNPFILCMKASEFLCPELVSTDTDDDDDDDLTAAGSEYESRMHTTTATPTLSASRSARAQNKWNGSNGTRTDGYVFEKARGREFPW